MSLYIMMIYSQHHSIQEKKGFTMQTPLSPRSRTTLAAQAVLLACAGFLLLACGGGGGNGGSSAVAGGGAGTAAFTVSGEISVAA
ncbi:MAG: hypothetical protein PVG46_09015, partial [Desulfobacterales bacterium]